MAARKRSPGRRRTDDEVAARRAMIYQWWSLDRWNVNDRRVLCAKFDITPRQLRDDLKKVKDARAARLNLSDTEAIRAELVETLRTVQRLAALHLTCTECRGAGYHAEVRCEECKGTGARLECSPQWARVIQTGVEQVRKLAGIEAAPESVVQVVIETASPLALLDQVRAGVHAIEAAGILTVPVED